MSGGDDPLNPIERIVFDHIKECSAVLDIGAGNLRVKKKMLNAGFTGKYMTLDRSPEFDPDYSSLEELPEGQFDAICMLELIEHIPLADFDEFMDAVLQALSPGGRLVISTPNAEFISTIWAADITHVHAYRAADLAAYLHLRGVRSTIYRITWKTPHAPLKERIRFQAARLLTRGILQVDYAKGVLLTGECFQEP